MDIYNSNINIEIQTGNHSHLNTDWKFKNDRSTHARLYYIKSGSAHLNRDSERVMLLPGKLYLIPPDSNFSAGCRDKVEIIWIHFTFNIFSSIPIFNLAEFTYESKPPDRQLAESSMKKLVDFHRSPDLKLRLELAGILMQFVSLFAKDKTALDEREKNPLIRFAPVLDYIDRHCKEKISVSKLAQKASLERAYFSTLFSRTFGIPVKKYILKKKIDKAKTMLLKDAMKIEDCGRELGFNDGFHFSKTFKKIAGISPREFIRSPHRIIP